MEKDLHLLTKIIMLIFLNNVPTRKDTFDDFEQEGIKVENGKIETEDGHEIGYYIISPASTENPRYIVTLHGTGDNRKTFFVSNKVNLLVQKGFTLIIPDYRGFGDSEGPFTVDGGNEDINATVEHLKETKKIKNEKIFLLGYSFGTGTALEYIRYSSENNGSIQKKGINKVALLAPFLNTLEIMCENEAWRVLEKVYPNADKIIKEEFYYANDENIKKIEKENIVIFHGQNDQMVPFEQGKKLADIAGCRFEELPDANHYNLFSNEHVLNVLNEFFN